MKILCTADPHNDKKFIAGTGIGAGAILIIGAVLKYIISR